MSLPTPYAPNATHTVPARSSVAVPLSASQKLTVTNTHGTQVIDFWAFEVPPGAPSSPAATKQELTTYLSMSHTRASLLSLSPIAPCTLSTNQRTPILKFISDSSGCIHDTLIPACDIHRYHQLGVAQDQYHANCSDNLRMALSRDTPGYTLPAPFKTPTSTVPDPLNLFMNIPVSPLPQPLHESNSSAGGALSFQPTVCEQGGQVAFEALVDCIVVMSCCPQDLVPEVNGGVINDCHFVVEG
ncbi:uncharacterized protein A1O5_01616 [Cladophialophora psammophila CBS 110553]|uniref:DUF1989 domain-containing protein n=1 Tax=Cladophialophora psammophila CBS 110553 TaxID=1182543 RepID=W9XC81_9EURO|nr:uncharacterized protein A1O5_01616 [Cladophialophora psammophila CBS 110553]EXJ74920.1 hypothetical protein A1O5_01616 [Cladophialophora psammophila CBS 110553]